MKTVEERLAYLEAKVERMEKLERDHEKTRIALLQIAGVADRNFSALSGRVSRKSDGFFSDMFGF